MISTWDFSTGLKECRKARGLTQTELAQMCGLQPSAIGHFEQGSRLPSLVNLIRLADALNTTLDLLVARR